MTDIKELREIQGQPETDEFDRAAGRAERGFDQARVEAESERLKENYRSQQDDPPSSQDHLDRLDRIEERSSMRHSSDFSPEREAQLEDRAIRANPEGELRRAEGGLDRETEWKLGESLSEQEEQLRKQGRDQG